jgi:hypothetical protein
MKERNCKCGELPETATSLEWQHHLYNQLEPVLISWDPSQVAQKPVDQRGSSQLSSTLYLFLGPNFLFENFLSLPSPSLPALHFLAGGHKNLTDSWEQCFGSGSAWIRIKFVSWIRIQLLIKLA